MAILDLFVTVLYPSIVLFIASLEMFHPIAERFLRLGSIISPHRWKLPVIEMLVQLVQLSGETDLTRQGLFEFIQRGPHDRSQQIEMLNLLEKNDSQRSGTRLKPLFDQSEIFLCRDLLKNRLDQRENEF
jgi:hypothetical protein